MKLLILLMVIWNTIAFIMMGIDKRRAIKDQERISEKTLLISAFIMALIVNAGIIYGLIHFNIV